MKKKAYNYFKSIGAPQRYTGFNYVIEAVDCIAKDPTRQLTKDIYVQIASHTSKNVRDIERGIRTFIEALYDECDTNKKLVALGCSFGRRRVPRNNEFLHCLANYLTYEEVE